MENELMPQRQLPRPIHLATLQRWLLLAVWVALTACAQSVGNHANASATNTQKQASELKESEMNWRRQCVGRVTMAFPEQGHGEWSQAFHGGHFERLPQPMGLTVFWQGIDRIKASYVAQKHFDHSSMLAYFEKVNEHTAAVIHYRSELTRFGPGIRTFIWLDDYHAYELTDGHTYAKDVPPTPQVFAEAIAANAKAMQNIKPLDKSAVGSPDEPGFCIDGALVTDYTDWNAQVVYAHELQRGTRLTVSYRENLNQAETYTGFEKLRFDEKRAEVLPKYGAAHHEFTILRKQERMLDGLMGQEFITRTIDHKGVRFYGFRWGVRGANDRSVVHPAIAIHMSTPDRAIEAATQKPFPPLPSEAQLLAVWEQALNSFRVVPNGLPNGQRIKAFNQDDGQTPYKAP